MKCPAKRLSGSAVRAIIQIVTQSGKYSPRLNAKRNAARQRHSEKGRHE